MAERSSLKSHTHTKCEVCRSHHHLAAANGAFEVNEGEYFTPIPINITQVWSSGSDKCWTCSTNTGYFDKM